MRNFVKKQKGITLIALVVTIIVLIILAGVSINMLVGENGIITQAQTAKEENGRAEIIEKIQLEIADKQAENLGTINEDEFYEILGKYGTVSADKTTLTTTEGNYEIAIADIYSGELESSLVTTPIESWEYTLDDENKTITLIKYIGTDAKIFVPEKFNINEQNYIVILPQSTEEDGPFTSNTIIKEVKFSDNIYLENRYSLSLLFYNCTSLEKVYNLLTKVYNSQDIPTVCSNTFANCYFLKEAPKIPDGVRNISYMFANCTELEKAPDIPNTVTDMSGTFQSCVKLNGIINIYADEIINAERCFTEDPLSIRLKINENTTTYNTLYSLLNTWEDVEIYYETEMTIACWGDSLTVGGSVSYPKILARLCKTAEVFNLGVGGEGSKKIAIRQGGIPLYVESFVIPSDVSYVEINLIDEDGNKVIIGGQGTAGLNPCYIDGIEGEIVYDNYGGIERTLFIRKETGEEKRISNNTQIITSGMNLYNDSDIVIIWSGTNDTPDTSSVSNVINNIDAMINYSNNDKYIIIGLTSKNYMSEVEEVNQILANKYGEHFLDIRKYILENGLSDAGIVATAQDLEDIRNGEVPSSLRIDTVHLNAAGYTIVGEQVYNKLIEFGYIEE